MHPKIKELIQELRASEILDDEALARGNMLYLNGQIQILSVGKNQVEVLIDDEYDDFEVAITFGKGDISSKTRGSKETEPAHIIATLMQYNDELLRNERQHLPVGKTYTREGMIRRVLAERTEKAVRADYRIEFAANPYGQHVLTNENGAKYKFTFHDLTKETGYCTCQDYRTNKLGTCKHLMNAYLQKKGDKKSLRKPKKPFPFVDVHLDPLKNYQICWFHPDPHLLSDEVREVLHTYFGEETHIPEDPVRIRSLLQFVQQADQMKQILVRPEVNERIELAFQDDLLEKVKANHQMDLSGLKATLYPYQKKGVEFAAYKSGVIIADEMGLGKTLQAIATALVKKDAFGFTKTLIVCPASLKDQWKKEIEKFTTESAVVVSGRPDEREKIYRESDAYFFIINYETILRDKNVLNQMELDFIILDEAQRIKNYETITARSVKALHKKHALVITGTPIENRLVDLFSIMDFIDPYFLTPLWEFSQKHCYFDKEKKNKITGYFNLQELKERLKPILLRRTKREVIDDLPNVTQIDVPVAMHFDQAMMHTGYAKGVAQIIRKKFLTPYDFNKLMMLLNKMRMVCDSTFLVDGETNISPKLDELKHILEEKLDIVQSDRKAIIFSEWTRMNGLIGQLLRKIGVTYVELNGKVPIPKRQALVDKFYHDPECKVFVSTEAGGAGLNLQAADTVINFELPWNPAKKNQRIGRIDRLGQEADQLTVINLITPNSIEMRIATGLMLKQNLFENVLNKETVGDEVDFSDKGRAQFLKELSMLIEDLAEPGPMSGQEPDEELDGPIIQMAKEISEEGLIPTQEPEPVDEKTAEPTPAIAAASTSSNGATTPSGTPAPELVEMEQVMNHGLNFLSGMFKMATGKDLATEDQKIEVDHETGEVVMRFKMPKI
ncbi:MAG: DEAD/DEAH box helicase [Bacteroidota bacterium]